MSMILMNDVMMMITEDQDYLFIYLFVPPALNSTSYDRTRALEAPSRPMLVIGRRFHEEMER